MKHLPSLIFEDLEGACKDKKMYRAIQKIHPKTNGKVFKQLCNVTLNPAVILKKLP
jgi:hypothetical protein